MENNRLILILSTIKSGLETVVNDKELNRKQINDLLETAISLLEIINVKLETDIKLESINFDIKELERIVEAYIETMPDKDKKELAKKCLPEFVQWVHRVNILSEHMISR